MLFERIDMIFGFEFFAAPVFSGFPRHFRASYLVFCAVFRTTDFHKWLRRLSISKKVAKSQKAVHIYVCQKMGTRPILDFSALIPSTNQCNQLCEELGLKVIRHVRLTQSYRNLHICSHFCLSGCSSAFLFFA